MDNETPSDRFARFQNVEAYLADLQANRPKRPDEPLRSKLNFDGHPCDVFILNGVAHYKMEDVCIIFGVSPEEFEESEGFEGVLHETLTTMDTGALFWSQWVSSDDLTPMISECETPGVAEWFHELAVKIAKSRGEKPPYAPGA